MTISFEPGKAYFDRSLCDHECIFSFTIANRAAKTIRTKVQGKMVSRRITVVDGVEQFKPFGTYSMCAIVRADKVQP